MNNDQKRITLFANKEECCGCGACMNICPKKAIVMKPDEFGFLFPKINYELCAGCGLCKSICAYPKTILKQEPLVTYVAVNNCKEQLMKSASGGIFAALASKVLESKGIVVGVKLEKEKSTLVPKHVCISDKKDLECLQGSKYVQSDTGRTFVEIQSHLKQGQNVFFSGTPCQVAGLKSFLRKEYENLVTVDVICHGVPSANMFQDYLSTILKKQESIESFLFRAKDKQGWGYTAKLKYSSKQGKEYIKYLPARTSSYFTFFLDGKIARESCYTCPYACKKRVGDISIGDYWGIKKEHPELLKSEDFREETGISCVMANTLKGEKLLKEVKGLITIQKSELEKVARHNGQINKPHEMPEERKKIMNLYKNEGYPGVERYYKSHYRRKIIIHTLFNKLPRNMRNYLKNLLK